VAGALTAFQHSLRLAPGDGWSAAALGYCAEINGDWKLALRYYNQAISRNSQNWYAHEGLDRVRKQIAPDAGRGEL